MEHILLVVHIIIAAALIGMVLLQRSETDGFGMGSGGGSNLLSGRASANLMTRTTAILAALFIANSLLLSILASNHRAPSIVESIEKEQAKETFSAPVVPNAGEDKATTDAAKKAFEKVGGPTSKADANADAKESEKAAPVVKEKAAAPKPVVKAKAKPAAPEENEGESQPE